MKMRRESSGTLLPLTLLVRSTDLARFTGRSLRSLDSTLEATWSTSERLEEIFTSGMHRRRRCVPRSLSTVLRSPSLSRPQWIWTEYIGVPSAIKHLEFNYNGS